MSSWNNTQNVLCVRLDSLGDVLMTTPAIRAIKEAPSMSSVTLLTSDSGAAIAGLVSEIDDVIVYRAPWMKSTRPGEDAASDFKMIEKIRERNFDAAVIFTVYSQSALPAALMCYLAGIPLRLAHSRENPYQLLSDWVPEPEPDKGIRHEVRRQLDLVASVGFSTTDEQLSLSVSTAVNDRVAKWINGWNPGGGEQPLIVLHPGATAASRRYAPEKFAAVGKRLFDEEGARLVLTGSADEELLIESIRRQMGVPSISLAGKLDLEELAALIRQASVLIVNNTGPAHMAAALGTPVVALYALTNPQHTPWQVQSRVLFQDVPCKFCYKSICPEHHQNCLRLVEPERVVSAVRDLLKVPKQTCTP